MKYLIPAILAFIGGLVLWLIKRDRRSLEYEIIESEIFPRDTGTGKYFVIKLKNNGNKPISDTELRITFESGNVESLNFSNDDLVSNIEKESNYVKGSIPLLNPSEILSITITTIDANVQTKPEIQARAVGVTASEKRKGDSIPDYVQNILAAIAVGVAATILFTTWITFRQTTTVKSIDELKDKIANVGEKSDELKELVKKRELGAPDTEQIIFGILNRAGLGHLVPKLVCTGAQIEYWKTGIFLVHSFLVDQENSKKYFSAMEQLIEIDKMSPASKGFNLYLLGKMHHLSGNSKEAISYFEQCKNATPLMYEHLMNQDPAYDLRELQKYLKKANKN